MAATTLVVELSQKHIQPLLDEVTVALTEADRQLREAGAEIDSLRGENARLRQRIAELESGETRDILSLPAGATLAAGTVLTYSGPGDGWSWYRYGPNWGNVIEIARERTYTPPPGKWHVQVRPRDGGQALRATAVLVTVSAGTVPATPAEPAKPAPAPSECLPGGVVLLEDGIPLVRQSSSMLGITAVRAWKGWSDLTKAEIATLVGWRDSGLYTFLTINPIDRKSSPNASWSLGGRDVTGFFKRQRALWIEAGVRAVGGGNELHLDQYRPDDLRGTKTWHKRYVTEFLRPLYEICGDVVEVYCTSVTTEGGLTNFDEFDALHAAGAHQVCHGFDIHPYPNPANITASMERVRLLKAQWGCKATSSELALNYKAKLSDADFAKYTPVLIEMAKATFDSFYIFAIFERGAGGNQDAWRLFDAGGKPTRYFEPYRAALTVA